MKITGVKVFYSENRQPMVPWHRQFWQFGVEVETDAGLRGIGAGGGGVASVEVVKHLLSDVVMGRNPEEVETLWEEMYQVTHAIGRKGIALMAISGVDIALWDLVGKMRNEPLYRCLGGKEKKAIPIYATGNDVSEYQNLGFRSFKMTRAANPSDGEEGKQRNEERVAQAREIVGEEADLMIDCGKSWTVDYTLEMAERLEPYRLKWIEEPIVQDDYEGYARLTREVKGTSIATGEHEYTHYGFKLLLENKCAHILQPDITWCGGLTDALKTCRMAKEYGVPVIPHRGGEIWGLHLVAAMDCPMAEVVLAGGGVPNFPAPGVQPLPEFKDGYITPGDQPGLGVDWAGEINYL